MKLQPFSQSEPRFSIITPSDNHGRYIRRNIESVVAQEYPHFEHLVFDKDSSDETHSILKQFTHVTWCSEPSSQLGNLIRRGIEQATGEIIGILPAYTYLAKGVFRDVLQHLQNNPLVMGAYQLEKEKGDDSQLIKNTERSWFDVLKYWVYQSSPSMSAVFFRKDLLEHVRESYGEVFDSDFSLSAEYDLWLKLTKLCGLKNQSEALYSHHLLEEEAGAPQEGKAMYREASRVFRRHSIRSTLSECRVSVVIVADSVTPYFERTLQSCSQQSLADYEILVWARGEKGAEVKRFVDDVASMSNDGRYRSIVTPKGEQFFGDFAPLLDSVRAPLLMLLFPGQELTENAVLEVSNSFEQDSLSLLLPCGGVQDLYRGLITTKDEVDLFNVQSLFSGKPLPKSCVLRTVAVREVLENDLSDDDAIALREFYLLFQYKAWSVQVIPEGVFSVDVHDVVSQINSGQVSQEYLQAKLIDRIAQVREGDPFAEVRAQHGFIIEFPEETVSAARDYLTKQKR